MDIHIDAVWIDLSVDPVATLAARLTPDTRMVWLESPSNPLLKLVDVAAVASSAHAHTGARDESPIVVVDNTFASPLSQQPLLLGADIVYHSATKYLSGHSDTINGVLATSREDLFTRLKFLQNAIGAVPGPFDCFLVLRGLRTLELRIARHSSNGHQCYKSPGWSIIRQNWKQYNCAGAKSAQEKLAFRPNIP